MTFEERLAQALLLVPPAILLGRSVMVHGFDVDAALPIAMVAYHLFHGLLGRTGGKGRSGRAAALLGAVAGATIAVLLVQLLPGAMPLALSVPAFVVLTGALLHLLSRRSEDALARRTIGGLWSVLSVLAITSLADGVHGSAADTVAGIAIALLVVAHGIAAGGVVRTVLGALALLGFLWVKGGAVIALVLGGGWGALAALGVAAIVAGSLFERFGPALKLRAARRYGRSGSSAVGTGAIDAGTGDAPNDDDRLDGHDGADDTAGATERPLAA